MGYYLSKHLLYGPDNNYDYYSGAAASLPDLIYSSLQPSKVCVMTSIL